jgi:TrmH family RNA methyltransferase
LSARSTLDDLVVVLVRPRNPLNIGAAARAMSNFGVSQLRLVNPYALAFREARSAVGAFELLKSARQFKTVSEAVADCRLVIGTTAVRNRALQHPLKRLDLTAGREICRQLQSGRVALLFGSEKIGLTNDDFTHCHWLLHIPTQEQHISMNLGQAVAVCVFQLSRAFDSTKGSSPSSRAEKHQPATAGDNEQITEVLRDALDRSGYVKPGTDAVMEKKVRQLVRRLDLNEMDAKVLLGMMRQIVWKVRQVPRG